MAEQSPTIEQPRRRTRPETSAWLMLLTFFAIFCAIVAGVGFLGWRAYTGATEPVDGSLVRVHAPAGVTYQAKGKSSQDKPITPCKDNPSGITDTCVYLNEGDRVRAIAGVVYGQVASIKLPDQTQVDMWSHPTGADLTLQKYQVSRWSRQRQEVIFSQAGGYARYDIPAKDSQQYDDVRYQVVITTGLTLSLAPGGSYSVNVPHADQIHPALLTAAGKPILVEVAVRTGSVEVQTSSATVTVQADQTVQVDTDKVATEPLTGRWQLIHDGNFSQYAAGTQLWTDYFDLFDRTVTPAEQNGKFSVLQGCQPETPVFCSPTQTTTIGQFEREGDQPKSYAKGVQQLLDVDVSEYRSLYFTIRASVIKQSIAQAGIANSECPVTIQFVFKQKSPNDPEERHFLCLYQADAAQPGPQNTGDYTYQGVEKSRWYYLNYDLRDFESLETAYYLQKIIVYANGHDYISQVTDISLVASQQR